MMRCTEHTRRVENPKVRCCICREVLRPGERYRQRVSVQEEWTEDSYERDVAHASCAWGDQAWDLYEEPPPWKPPERREGIEPDEHKLLLHCLGMAEHIPRERHGYRSWGAFPPDDELAQRLVAKGLMVRGGGIPGGLFYFFVTRAGGKAVGRPDLGAEQCGACNNQGIVRGLNGPGSRSPCYNRSCASHRRA